MKLGDRGRKGLKIAKDFDRVHHLGELSYNKENFWIS
jgi:hypothetical protein